ncbi:hypothetical protein AURDEDRAFT_171399 [Auricularia subglabra TFB-10046 SS5]|uniref:Uncharacterized protein n=1 Tax=Auricularia subglabra (strain TFB-10046 / SS5) TaxID=717982 RepID=J0DC53_AURST|nr:hypothetical protein AURDEDRAFT_171399 [Auricularia subglabra TFB-10046 SS5]
MRKAGRRPDGSLFTESEIIEDLRAHSAAFKTVRLADSAEPASWISRADVRALKERSTLLVNLATAEDAASFVAMRRCLFAFGCPCEPGEYAPQERERICRRCWNPLARQKERDHACRERCRLCGGSHAEEEHTCGECDVLAKPCAHIPLKCVNCGLGHAADDGICEYRRRARGTLATAPPMAGGSQRGAAPGAPGKKGKKKSDKRVRILEPHEPFPTDPAPPSPCSPPSPTPPPPTPPPPPLPLPLGQAPPAATPDTAPERPAAPSLRRKRDKHRKQTPGAQPGAMPHGTGPDTRQRAVLASKSAAASVAAPLPAPETAASLAPEVTPPLAPDVAAKPAARPGAALERDGASSPVIDEADMSAVRDLVGPVSAQVRTLAPAAQAPAPACQEVRGALSLHAWRPRTPNARADGGGPPTSSDDYASAVSWAAEMQASRGKANMMGKSDKSLQKLALDMAAAAASYNPAAGSDTDLTPADA